MDIVAAREIAQSHGWLSQTPPSFRREVLDRCYLQSFKAGETVFIVGDPPGGMYGLVSGGLGVSIAPGERGPYFGHFARPGTWFGEASVITGQPRQVGLSVTRDTDLLHLPLHGVHEIVGKDAAVWRYLAFISIGHLDVALGASDDLMMRDHVKRCVAILLRLGGCRRAPPNSLPVEIDVHQEDVAVLANVSRTTAGTVLRKLEAMGYLEQAYRRIRLLAPEALRSMLRE